MEDANTPPLHGEHDLFRDLLYPRDLPFLGVEPPVEAPLPLRVQPQDFLDPFLPGSYLLL
jgi:hypothetical protein